MNKLPGQDGIPLVGVSSPSLGIQQPQPVTLRQSAPSSIPSSSTQGESKVLDKRRIQELVKEVDPMEQLDEEVEEALLSIADDFIDSVLTAACQIAKHRKSNTLEVKDVQLHLERNWNMWIPGFGSDELRPYKKSVSTEAHKQVGHRLINKLYKQKNL
ncbi:hypothetical protein FSP39_003345 [Pinctada imbricata]|uniref:Transcription initiation factor TFIID subunit 12 n=1 Tax=Pinctada imbricata TaxID=66713 RepID=A0AA89BWB3_PINIB|nr:hypothetical protein FSP39_003345 [Pinctada imbricata]